MAEDIKKETAEKADVKEDSKAAECSEKSKKECTEKKEKSEKADKKAEKKAEAKKVEELTEKLEDTQRLLAEAQDKQLRLMAEFDNYRRRTQKEKDAIYPDAQADTVTKLLPLLDNFERALTAPCSDAEYLKGIEMTYKSFIETLSGIGLEAIGNAGDTFDAKLHNAVMHIEDEKYGENEIVTVFQKGYRIGDRVLRYAMVQTAN